MLTLCKRFQKPQDAEGKGPVLNRACGTTLILSVLCVTQRHVSKARPCVLREVGVHTKRDEAGPVCLAFRTSGVKRERELERKVESELEGASSAPAAELTLFSCHLFTRFACRRTSCSDVLHFK